MYYRRLSLSNVALDTMEGSQLVVEHEMPAVSSTPVPEETVLPASTAVATVPIPMSFPAILRVSGRAAHMSGPLYNNSDEALLAARQKRGSKRDEKEGKRWIRRKENGLSSLLVISFLTLR